MSTSPSSRASAASCQGVTVPTAWLHAGGPLHRLLKFQRYACGVCRKSFTWQPGPLSEPVQWVEDDLLLGLVCKRCLRRYKELGKQPPTLTLSRYLHQFRTNPPGQMCTATQGKGRQRSARRRWNALIAAVEAPVAWSRQGTVIHSLFLFQHGRCGICSTGLLVNTAPGSVHVDHDPQTEMLRGLLCHRCNVSLGKPPESVDWAHAAVFRRLYLECPPAQVFPATKGLTYQQERRPADIRISSDGTQILYDGMPASIASPPPCAVHRRSTQHRPVTWFALRYRDPAPAGHRGVVRATGMAVEEIAGEPTYRFYNGPLSASQPVYQAAVDSVERVTVHHSAVEAAIAAAAVD